LTETRTGVVSSGSSKEKLIGSDGDNNEDSMIGRLMSRLESASSCRTSYIFVDTIIPEEEVVGVIEEAILATGVGILVILVRVSIPVVNLMTTPSTVVLYSIDPGTIRVGR